MKAPDDGRSWNEPIPLYEKVKLFVVDRISGGSLEIGAKLPSENELAAQLSVSRLTVHRALRELASEGVIRRVHGVGSFVAQPRDYASIVHLHNIADVIRSRGAKLSTEVVELSSVSAGVSLGRMFHIPAHAPLFHSLVVYCSDGLPMQLEARYILPDFAPDYLKQDFRTMSTTSYLYSLAAPTRASNIIEAVLPNKREAKLLQILPPEPCLTVTRTTWVQRMLTGFSVFTHPGSRHRISSEQEGKTIK